MTAWKNQKLKKLLGQYDYKLPRELVAQKPASPRDAARLLVYRRKDGKIFYDTFLNLPKYLPPRAVLVLNETRVIPARLPVVKGTGGIAEILFLAAKNGLAEVLCEKKLPPGSMVKVVGADLRFKVRGQNKSVYFLKPAFPLRRIYSVLQKYGKTPLPPYIKHSGLSEREKREKYQSVFALAGHSAAAPTASLHFTRRLLVKLKKAGAVMKFARLDVGLGTFAPLRPENVRTKKLHAEYYSVSRPVANFLNRVKRERRPIIAVGTTALRTLESAAGKRAALKKLSGETRLFIRPGYKFKFADGLITNFHVPRSSLMMLAAALVGRKKLLRIYQNAIRRQFRFYSFGDGMLIL